MWLTVRRSPSCALCRNLRPLQNIDYFIPGDDPHRRQHSPSPVRDRRRSSRSRSRDPNGASGAASSAVKLQPLFAAAIEEEEDADSRAQADAEAAAGHNNGDAASDGARQGEASHDEAELEADEGSVEEQLEQADEERDGGAVSGRRKSTRTKRAESTRAVLRRKTAELVDSAAQLVTGKRKARGRKSRAAVEEEEREDEEAVEEQLEANEEEEEQEEESEQPGQEAQQEEDEEEAENSQPEGTPAKPRRRRSSRLTSQLSQSPLRALSSMLPQSVTSRLAAVGEGVSGDRRDVEHGERREAAETEEEAVEEDLNGHQPALSMASLFSWRWLLPGLLVALLSSLALLQLFQPHLLPWSASSSHSFPSSLLPLQEADWHRLSSSFLPIKDWHSYKQRWEQWIEDDKRRVADVVTSVKGWVEERLHKVERRQDAAESAADVSELRAELSAKLKESRAGWLKEMSELVEQQIAGSLGDEAKSRQADVQRATDELRGEMEQRVADEVQRGAEQLLSTVSEQLKQQLTSQADGDGERDAEWQRRLTDEVAGVEQRAVRAALAVVEKRFVSSEQLQAVDDDIRGYIQSALAEQAKQYASADELRQVEERVMTAVQQLTDKHTSQQQLQSGEQRLSADDRKQLIAEVLQAVRQEWAAEGKKMQDELRSSLTKTGAEAEKEHSAAIDQLRQQVTELEERLASSQSKEGGAVDGSVRQWVEERVQSALEGVRSGESSQQDVARKLRDIEAALKKLQADASSSTHSSTSSSSAAAITAALERFAADRTAQVDYALASSGGHIVAHSPTHRATLSSSSVVSPLLSFFTSGHLPEVPADALLDADMSVGHCWPMQTPRGSVLIKLRERIHVTGLALQHASVHVLPDGGASMPRQVRLSGVDDEQLADAIAQVRAGEVAASTGELAGSVLGQFEYERDGTQVQQWPVGRKGQGDSGRGYQHVRLDVLNNYGNSNYTCIYRVRVHGEPVKAQ